MLAWSVIAEEAGVWRGLARWAKSINFRELAFRVAAVSGMVFAAVVAIDLLDVYLGVRSPSMTFLTSVILTATFFGQRQALFAAFLAFGVFNAYLAENPYGLSAGERLLTLLVFVGAAIIVGGIAGRLHDQEGRARAQADIFRSLFAVSRSMAERRTLQDTYADMVDYARRLGAANAAVIPRHGEAVVSPRADALPISVLSDANHLLLGNASGPLLQEGWRLEPIAGVDGPVAVLAWRPGPQAGDDQNIALGLLVDLGRTSVQRLVSVQQRIEMDALAATEKLRSALMASMSHDFRTPLATIMASASSLLTQREKLSNDVQTDFLTSIQEEAERLNRYVANILAMTRLDAKALQVRADWVDPAEVLEAVSTRVSKRLGQRQLKLLAPAAAPSIFADAILLEQALANVIENALHYTQPNATILLGCESRNGEVILWAEDNGPGVAPADIGRIFDKFRRLDHSSNATHGAGLGLAISKGFVEAMGGAASASPARLSRTGLRISFAFPTETSMAAT